MNVVDFKGTARDHRRILHCPDCGSAVFKIVKHGASEVPKVECSNCECTLKAISVQETTND